MNHFPNSGQTESAGSNELLKCCRDLSFQYNGLLYCRACVSSEAYTVLFARKISNFSNDALRIFIRTESTNILSAAIQIDIVVLKRSSGHKRYPPQVQHPLRITSGASSRGQPSLNEHLLRKQGYVRVRRCKFLTNIVLVRNGEQKGHSYFYSIFFVAVRFCTNMYNPFFFVFLEVLSMVSSHGMHSSSTSQQFNWCERLQK